MGAQSDADQVYPRCHALTTRPESHKSTTTSASTLIPIPSEYPQQISNLGKTVGNVLLVLSGVAEDEPAILVF